MAKKALMPGATSGSGEGGHFKLIEMNLFGVMFTTYTHCVIVLVDRKLYYHHDPAPAVSCSASE